MPHSHPLIRATAAQIDAINAIAAQAPKQDQEDFFGYSWPDIDCFALETIGEKGFALRFPHLDPIRAEIFAYVLPEHRQQGIFSALLSAIQASLTKQITLTARVLDRHSYSAKALQALGFQTEAVELEMGGALIAKSETDFGPDIGFQTYRGGDDGLDHQIATLENRLYTRTLNDTRTTAGVIARRFHTRPIVMLLARNAQEQLIGQIEAMTKPPFCTRIGVTRPHWGTGLAQELATRLINAMVRDGLTKTYSIVSETNHASLRLNRAFGLEVIGRITTYTRSLPSN